jgi:hypothetical protein
LWSHLSRHTAPNKGEGEEDVKGMRPPFSRRVMISKNEKRPTNIIVEERKPWLDTVAMNLTTTLKPDT